MIVICVHTSHMNCCSIICCVRIFVYSVYLYITFDIYSSDIVIYMLWLCTVYYFTVTEILISGIYYIMT